MKIVEKPRFKKKWKDIALSHRGKVPIPFPGRNKVRWAIVEPIPRKTVVYYEGKPSTQAMEFLRGQRRRPLVYWMEFDREGVFFVQAVSYGNISEYENQLVRSMWKHYHPKDAGMTDYVKRFVRP